MRITERGPNPRCRRALGGGLARGQSYRALPWRTSLRVIAGRLLALAAFIGIALAAALTPSPASAETELTGGFHTEYSGMRFSLFFLAEYANIIVVSAVVAIMFLGGWMRPFPNVEALSFLDLIPPWIWFTGKIFGFLYVFIWLRATLPRLRYDQLMELGWKVLIPIALGNLVLTGVAKVVF